MRKIQIKRGFTLIEILVVATIIGLLASGAIVSYQQLSKQSRDAKRKTDLAQIRASLEMYRSNNDTYPVGSWSNLSVLTTPVTYIQSLPGDPKNPTYIYYYNSADGSDYTLASHLETVDTTCQSLSNQCTSNCTYCLGPYGEK